jgi:ATP synthase F1, epsilon subunit
MAVHTIQVEVVSTEEEIFSGVAEHVVLTAEAGEIGIYPGHAPLITLLKPGVMRLVFPDAAGTKLLAISGGLAEVRPNLITVLADVVVRSEEMDQARAEEAKKKAEEKIKGQLSDSDRAKAEAALAVALAELKALSYIKTHQRADYN